MAVGDVVSIQLPNWYEFVVVAVATQRIGGVINPLLPVYRRKELLHVFTVAESKVVCTPASYRNHDHLAETRAGHCRVRAGPRARGGRRDTSRHERDGRGRHGLVRRHHGDWPAGARPASSRTADAVSELIFTSGTEAAPKAIMHTEQTANFSVRVAREDLGIGDGDVVWMPSPIGHSTGFNYGVRLALYHGLPLVLQDRWDAAVACDLIAAHRASYTLASTTFLQDLVAEAERRGRGGASRSMTRFGCGGSPVPPELVRRAGACGIGVLRLYGSTEVLVATWNRPGGPVDRRTRPTASPSATSRWRCGTRRARSVHRARAGEIHVRGPNTCVGFYRDPERTEATFCREAGFDPGTWPPWTPTAI